MEEGQQKMPLKHMYRAELIDKLRAAKLEEAMGQSLKSK